jgi:hypothetical protein
MCNTAKYRPDRDRPQGLFLNYSSRSMNAGRAVNGAMSFKIYLERKNRKGAIIFVKTQPQTQTLKTKMISVEAWSQANGAQML